jgi:hypothetical protein
MVQYNIPALTNSHVVVQGGGGGSGDVVYASNQTGNVTVTANDQVYLVRQTNFETKFWDARKDDSDVRSSYTFFMDNDLVRFRIVYRYNEGTDTWDKTTFSELNISPYRPIKDVIEGKTVYAACFINSDASSCIICDLNYQRQFPKATIWIGDGLALSLNTTSSKADIYPYDYETNTVDTSGDPLIVLNVPTSPGYTMYRIILTDGKILYAHDRVIDVYSRADYSLIRTIQFPNIFMIYVTGSEPGDYIFGTESTRYSNFDSNLMPVNTYKIMDDYSLEAVNDPLFSKMKAQKSGIIYNIETGILQIGFVGEVDAKIYQFDKIDKSWADITPIVDTTNIPGNGTDYVPIMAYNNDRTLLAYCGASYPASYKTYFFKLEITTGEWFAYNPDKKYVIPYQTLTGYTTGNTQNGKIEVATVLPPKVSLTVNVTPDPDTFDIIGAVK